MKKKCAICFSGQVRTGEQKSVKLDKNIWEYVTIPVSNGLSIIRKKAKELVY